MNHLYWKEAKILIYAYIKHQTEINQGISDNIWSWVYFCPKCKSEMNRLKLSESGFYDAPHEFHELRFKITDYYFCPQCEAMIQQEKCLHPRSVFRKIAEKFGYTEDCHGYHKIN